MVEYHAIQGAQAKFSNLYIYSKYQKQIVNYIYRICKTIFELLDIQYLNK